MLNSYYSIIYSQFVSTLHTHLSFTTEHELAKDQSFIYSNFHSRVKNKDLKGRQNDKFLKKASVETFKELSYLNSTPKLI